MKKNDYLQSKNLTSTQKDILSKLCVDGADLTWSKGGGWWIGENQTNGRLVNVLIRHGAISMDGYGNPDKYQTWEINGTGKMFLETGYLWIHIGTLK